MEKRRKQGLIILSAVLVLVIVLALILNVISSKKPNKVAVMNNELKRAMTYNEITDDDANIDNCEYVKFNSFFTRDLDGDGYAEKYDGTCNYIDKTATLYFDINVLTDGRLENGKITINGKNFDLSTVLIKDEVLKNDYISNNVTELELNTINYGTQKLFYGNIKADIGNNINNYSVEDNQIILTGTWVSTDGTQSVPINKVINLKTDWYGKTTTSIYDYFTHSHDIATAIQSDAIVLDFNVGEYRETANELLIQKQVTEVTIPDLNGFAPIEVVSTSQNCTYNYDEETRILTITREAVVNDSGTITQTVSRYNTYSVQVKYPLEAYESLDENTISVTFPTTGYYYGFNNSSDEFSNENPYVSQASKSYTHTWSEPKGTAAIFDVSVGKYVYNSDTRSYRYIVSKQLPLNIYNNMGINEDENDEYIVTWKAYTGSTVANQNGIYMSESQNDKLLNSSGTYADMKDYIKTTGVYFSNLDGILADDGWIKIYDNETGELLLTATKEDWNNYKSDSPYRFDKEVKSIRVETSTASLTSYLYVYQIKEIDDEKLTADFTAEEFENLNYIYSYLTGGLFVDSVQMQVNTDQAYAYYEAPISVALFSVSPIAISNQETKNVTMTIQTETTYYNELKWKNGQFVIELPEEILEIDLKEVTIDNTNVEISSYETYEENGKKYIRIYTNNEDEATYKITINADITADPREPTVNRNIKLYSINENCHNYRSSSRAEDVLDINGNGNVDEYVLYKSVSMQIIAPTSLLTSQTLSNFDDDGTEVVSPQIAILDKSGNSRDAQINQTITNNYSGTISEVKIIGKIPFEGNTYQINGKNLGSTYSVTMKEGGITLPDSVKDTAKVYYSTNETVTDDLTNADNNWKLSTEVEDWASIKNYMIDLSDYVLAMKESLTFYYGIEIPANISYNDITYSTHAVSFCLDTEDGKLRTQTEVNRLGIMIAKKYSVNLTKYKSGTNTKVKGATYKITDGTLTRTGITDKNGNISISGLYIDKEYTLSEIQSPTNYILNSDEIKFIVTVDEEGNPQVNIISGTLKNEGNITNQDGIYTLNLEVEDLAKYDVKITKTNTDNEVIKGVKFKLTGGAYGEIGKIFTTSSTGEIYLNSLIPNVEYKLQETKADGYYVKQNIMTFTVSRDSNNDLVVMSDDEDFTNAIISEEDGVDKATVNVNIKNEIIPTYSLNINKENKDGEKLAETQFKITSIDTNEVNYYTTDENGSIVIPNLYQYADGKYITGEYILQEVRASEGYITDTTEIRFKAEKQDGSMVITVLDGEGAIKAQEAGTDDITFIIENKEIFKLTKTGDNDQLLPGAVFKITDLDGNSVYDVNGNPIGELVGKAPVNLTFTTTETNPWTLRTDETWESGGKAVNNAVSTLTSNSFTLLEDSTLTFDWAVSSESASYDYLYYTITNEITGATIGGTSTKIGGYTTSDSYETLNFTTKEIDLPVGTYTITFTYRKDGSANKGLDAGFVRNVKIAGSGYYGLTTDENGEITANLPEGLYKVIEMEAPEGYDLPDNEEDRTYYVGIGANKPEETEFTIKAAKQITGSGWSSIYDVENTGDGGFITAGSFAGECDIDADGVVDVTAVGDYDQLVVKYDANCDVEWFKTFGTNQADELKSISLTSDGCYVVSGFEYSDNFEDAIVMKLDSSGNEIWKNTISGIYKDEMRDAEVLSNGTIIAVGRYYSPEVTIGTTTVSNSGLNDGFIVCYASSGDYLWHQTINGSNDIDITSVTETSQGIAVSVNFLGTITIGDSGTSITSAGNQDAAIITFFTDGTYLWNVQASGANDEAIAKLITDSEDNIVAVGGFASNLTFGTETITAPTTSYSNSLMVKVSPINGKYISSFLYGGTDNDDKIMSAVATEDGGILLGGWFYSKNFDIDGDGTNDITSVAGCNDGILVKLNDQNEVEWYRTITGSSYDAIYGVTQLPDKGLIAVGNFDSTSVSSGDKSGILASQGYNDSFVIELADVVTSAEIPQVQEIQSTNELKKFNVTTEIGENSDLERVGGTITGTPTTTENINLVEEVKYGYDSQNQIIITPDEDYSIYSVELNGEKVSFVPDDTGVVTIPIFEDVKEDYHVKVVFEKNLSSVVVHHYLKDRDGNYTTTQLAEDEYITGKVGSSYETVPRVDIEGYAIEKAVDGSYVIPTNAKGIYVQDQTVVIYYYEEQPFNLTVHHYLEGTEEKLVEDEISSHYKGAEYTTSSSDELLNRYVLVSDGTMVSPETAGTSGMIQEDTVVSYYYKLKEYKITTEVKGHEETDIAGNISNVKGGSISGEGMTPYETVIIDQNSTKDIVISADEGYQIKSITIQTIDENNNITEETVEINGKTVTYNLDPFESMSADKHIIVEYEKIVGTITVHHYIEGTTNSVPLLDGTTAADETRSGYVGDTYATSPVSNLSNRYELVSMPDNSSGNYVDGNIEVIYYYKEKVTSVLVHHYLEGTTISLSPDVTIDGIVEDNYATGVAAVDNKYEVVEIPVNANGVMTEEQIVVTYYYRVKDTSVLVHHYIEGTTTSLSADVTINGKVDEAYTTVVATDIPSKYELVAEPENKNGNMTVEQTVVTYYYRLKEAGVDVHYYKEGTTEKVSEDVTITGRVDDTYTTSEATDVPSKYELVAEPENKSGTMTEDRIVVIYYYRLKDTSVLVHHYLEGTTTSLSPDVTINGQVDDSYTTTEATELLFDKYELLMEPDNRSGVMTEDQIVVIYYYKLKDTSVLVHHYLEGTTTSLSEDVTINGKVDDTYTTNVAADIPNKYELVAEPENKTGTMTVEQTVVTYYYRVKDTSVLVHHYIEGTTTSLSEDVTINGKVDDAYTTDAATDIPSKYELVAEPENKNGNMTVEQTVVTYYYRVKDTSVLVHHYIKDTTTSLSKDVTIGGKVDDSYTTSVAADIPEYYELVAEPENKSGTMVENQIVVTYYYQLKEYSYVVNYLEVGTNAVLHEQKQGLNYIYGTNILSSNEIIEINGYNYDSVDKDTLTIDVENNVINIYYIKRSDLTYKVNYLESVTNNVIHEPKTQGGMTFEDVIRAEDEAIDIDGYNYDYPDKYELVIGTDENVINIYYSKVTGLGYKVNYLEKGTDKVLFPSNNQGDMTFGDVVVSSNEIIPVDGYVYDSVDKELLTIGTGENVINIYYVKRNDLSYTVNYLELDTDEILHESKTQGGMTFEDTVVSADEVIPIDGYVYDSVDKETLTISTGENIINIYYTKRNDLSYKVNYLEKDTNKVIHSQKTVNNAIFEEVISSSDEVIEIDGYNYDSADKDTLTISTGENIINIYYAKRTDLSYKVNYLEKDTNAVLSEQKVVENKTLEEVITSSSEVIEIDGYNYDSVDKDTLTISTGENIINIYYTKRNDLSYTVNYLEKNTNIVLSTQKEVTGQTFNSVITSLDEVIEIDGYNYDSVDKDTLTISTGENVINIYYTKRTDLSYTVNYLEKDTNKVIHSQKIVNDAIFGEVINSSDEIISINGYGYDSVDKDTLTISTGLNEITIYYTKINGLAYTVNYLELGTDLVLHEPKVQDEMTFEDEVLSSDEVIEIDGYNYDSVDKETLTIGTGENVINIYYTKRTDLSYKVNYLEKDTNNVLSEQKEVTGQTFNSVITSLDEVIDIDGYNYDSVDKDTLTITTGENVINIYYTKRNDLSYTVNYLEKDTNSVLHDSKTVENVTFESVITSLDEVITIPGYNYDSVDKETLTISTGLNEINIYYTKKDAKVTVHYYEEGTTNKVSEDVVITDKVFSQYITTGATDIPSKYELVAVPENATGEMTEEEIVVIYYYRKKATQVIVHHYEEGTTNKLSENVTIDGRVDDPYTTEVATDVPIKYELVANPENKVGTMTEDVIEVTYYYRVKDAILNIRYLEKGTDKVLADPEQQTGKVDENYITTEKPIEGYTLVEDSGNTMGTLTVEPITVTFYYLYNTKATVQYIDKTTGAIIEQRTQAGLEGDEFVTESKSFDNYILVEEPAEKTVNMTKDEIVLKYYYIHVSGGVIEKHIDVISGEILANESYEGNEGDPYNIPSRTFAGYDLVEDRLPVNSQGTMQVNPIEVTYYYIYKTKVTVKYVDKATGEELAPTEEQTGHETDRYTTERKIFDDYKLEEVPSNADGEMTKDEIVVTYYYVHTSGGVIVNHVDVNTGKQLRDETKQEGYEGDPYETHEENIPNYDLVEARYPTNATGTMTKDPTRVTYYYVKKTEVTVKYVDSETGEEIEVPETIPGHEGDDYSTKPKEIPGYDLAEEPENKDGKMTNEPTEVVYYYKRPAKVVVRYLDEETKEELATEEKIEGHQNDDYATNSKDIQYYTLTKVPENATGKMTVTVVKDAAGNEVVEDTTYVTYYYRKKIFNLKVDKQITSVIVNGEERPVNGNLGKVEINKTSLSTTSIQVVYKIIVTNNSELKGNASIVENIPEGMTMRKESNTEWEISEEIASLVTGEIQPGESREYKVVLDWVNDGNNVGTKENIAQIVKSENEAGYAEKDLTDDESSADLIISIGTGIGVKTYAIGGGITLIIFAAISVVVIEKKRKNKIK